ncbi:cysteine dioxygenase [Pseudorhodoferax sp.]|uniref:cysteine dioxygenase family protein n=1 Tax=Pseudorhodoferax sp. TaxID=1993553 RepID=UPI002DD62FF4|nr:cysteine dioxygenase [Pseudorhodoferax sp.]
MKADERLLHFVQSMHHLCERNLDEAALLDAVRPLLRELVAHDDWLPEACAQPDEHHYQQHLLYGDPLDRFSLVSFVWGPDQRTPVHDHTVWGAIGMLRGAETGQRYAWCDGRLEAQGAAHRLEPGEVECVSPRIGDIHQVANAFDDRVSISIHVYGANIGRTRRHVFGMPEGTVKDFVSGYSNTELPNLWHPRRA